MPAARNERGCVNVGRSRAVACGGAWRGLLVPADVAADIEGAPTVRFDVGRVGPSYAARRFLAEGLPCCVRRHACTAVASVVFRLRLRRGGSGRNRAFGRIAGVMPGIPVYASA